MATLTADRISEKQIGSRVEFTTQGFVVAGTLDNAYKILTTPDPSDWMHLTIDGETHCVDDTLPVVVA